MYLYALVRAEAAVCWAREEDGGPVFAPVLGKSDAEKKQRKRDR